MESLAADSAAPVSGTGRLIDSMFDSKWLLSAARDRLPAGLHQEMKQKTQIIAGNWSLCLDTIKNTQHSDVKPTTTQG